MTKERRRWKATAAAKRRGNEMSGQDPLDKTLAVSHIFCHQMVLIDQWNLWGEGPVLVGSGDTLVVQPQHSVICPARTFCTEHSFRYLFSKTNPEMAYVEHNHLKEDPNRIHRSEKDVSLHMTPVLVEHVKQAQQRTKLLDLHPLIRISLQSSRLSSI